jgi:RimJ/RimL family protein N-acetyltransferase
MSGAHLTVRPLSRLDATTIACWKYSGAYSYYNGVDGGESETVRYMLDPRNGFHAVCGPRGLQGFWSYGRDGRVPGYPYDDNALDIGTGMDPALVGQGHGRTFVDAVVRNAMNAPLLRVTIASWNERALRVWRSAGFHPVSTFRGAQGFDFTILTCARHHLTTARK